MGGMLAPGVLLGAPVDAPADAPTGAPSGAPSDAARLSAADPLLVARRHVDYLRIGSALCLPRPLPAARYS